jgi:hypothetical protein
MAKLELLLMHKVKTIYRVDWIDCGVQWAVALYLYKVWRFVPIKSWLLS